MAKSRGTIIKFVIITTILALVIGAIIWRVYYDGEKIETQENSKPQCNDGLDNDGDGKTDYGYDGDPDCKSPEDMFERDYTWLKTVISILAIIGLIYLVWIVARKHFNKDEKENLQEPVEPDRAYELVLSNLLKTRFKDIDVEIIREEDGYLLYRPICDEHIISFNRFPVEHPKTGVPIQFEDIEVNVGKWRGYHRLIFFIGKGEQHLKGGHIRFEKNKWEGNWTTRSRTYNISSPVAEKTRLAFETLDAIRDGDKDTVMQNQNLMNAIGSSQSAFVDEDDEEFKERMRLQNYQNAMKKNKSKKLSTKQKPIDMQQQNNNDFEFDAGGSEDD